MPTEALESAITQIGGRLRPVTTDAFAGAVAPVHYMGILARPGPRRAIRRTPKCLAADDRTTAITSAASQKARSIARIRAASIAEKPTPVAAVSRTATHNGHFGSRNNSAPGR